MTSFGKFWQDSPPECKATIPIERKVFQFEFLKSLSNPYRYEYFNCDLDFIPRIIKGPLNFLSEFIFSSEFFSGFIVVGIFGICF